MQELPTIHYILDEIKELKRRIVLLEMLVVRLKNEQHIQVVQRETSRFIVNDIDD